MNRFLKRFSLAALAMAALVLALPAQAQVTPVTVGTFTNVPTIIATAGVSNVNALVQLRQGRGISILPSFAGTNSGAANLRLEFDVSADGTNFTTTSPFVLTFAMNGTTGVIPWTNIPPSLLDNVAYLRLTKMTNAHTASLFITNVTYSIRN